MSVPQSNTAPYGAQQTIDAQHTGIETAPPNYSVPVDGVNEKGNYAPQAQYAETANHQQTFQQQAPGQNVPGPAPNNGKGYQMATPLANLQQGAAPVDCPVCGVRELTKTEFVSGGTTHGVAALLCFCFCLGCIPYIGSWLKDCEHKCGHCGALLAVWHKSGRTEVLAHARA